MSRLADHLRKRKEQGKKSLIVYITAGYPDLETTCRAILAAENAGADVIEIGIPFSDPIADGPVIQKAATAALAAGTTTRKTLDMIRKVRCQSSIPLAVMTYVNIVLNHGTEVFAKECRAAGVDAMIIPDLPPEEKDLLQGPCDAYNLELIQFVAPTSTADRIREISRTAAGFIYCVSNTGVTGVRSVDFSEASPSVHLIRQISDVPVAIGFGIGTPEVAREAAHHADAVIVGSAVVQLLPERNLEDMKNLISSLRQALDKEDGTDAGNSEQIRI